MTASAQILCTKCGNASTEARLECAKCGGRNARVCGGCGNENSIAKNFCDKCGQSLSSLGPISPPPKSALPGSPGADIPATAIKRLQPPVPDPPADVPFPIPVARDRPSALSRPGQQSPGFTAPLDDLWSAPPAPLLTEAQASREKSHFWRTVLNTTAAIAGAALAAYGVWTYRENRKPEVVVPKLAARYLEALRTRDYASAYQFFSEAAKRNCALEEFVGSRDDAPWTWSGLSIEYQEPGAILFAYELKVGASPPRRDHILFSRDDGRWARPYNLTLIRRVEKAFAEGDADKGLSLAQAAATVNPRDPMAWGYLCEAAYYRNSPMDTEQRCLKALELSQRYPSNLSLKSLYHLHAILADTEHHVLNKTDAALDQYGQMLSFPDISPADQCQVLLARSQAYAAMSRPGEALTDLNRCGQLCTDPRDRETIRRVREILNVPDVQ